MFVPAGSVTLKPGVPLNEIDVGNVSARYRYGVVTSNGVRTTDDKTGSVAGATSDDVALTVVLDVAAGSDNEPVILPTDGIAGCDAVVPTATEPDAELAVGGVTGTEGELLPPPPPPHATRNDAAPNALSSTPRWKILPFKL